MSLGWKLLLFKDWKTRLLSNSAPPSLHQSDFESRSDFDSPQTCTVKAVNRLQVEQEDNGDMKNESAMSNNSVQALLKSNKIVGIEATIMPP